MNKKPTARDKIEKRAAAGRAAEAKAVADYLRRHPDFLQGRPKLLAAMEIPQRRHAGTLSLIERQVKVLRERNHNLQRKLEQLLSNARGHEQLQERMYKLVVAGAAADSLDDVLVRLPEAVRREFDLQCSRVLADAGDAHPEDGATWFSREHVRYSRVRNRVEHRHSECRAKLPAEWRRFLFGDGDGARRIQSCAIVPLVAPDDDLDGVLALGSEDPARFAPDMGTIHLDFLGRVVGGALYRLVRARAGVHGQELGERQRNVG